MAKEDRLDDSIRRLAELAGWAPEKARGFVASIADAHADKAEARSRDVAKNVIEKALGKAGGVRAPKRIRQKKTITD